MDPNPTVKSEGRKYNHNNEQNTSLIERFAKQSSGRSQPRKTREAINQWFPMGLMGHLLGVVTRNITAAKEHPSSQWLLFGDGVGQRVPFSFP